MTQEALKLALEALEEINKLSIGENAICLPAEIDTAMDAIKEALAQEQEPVAHSVIAGVLFDFMGWLTSRKERIVLSSADNASPAVEAITEFAKMRNLSLDDAKVQDWNTTPPQRQWVGLTDEEIDAVTDSQWAKGVNKPIYAAHRAYARAIEAKLKEKNT